MTHPRAKEGQGTIFFNSGLRLKSCTQPLPAMMSEGELCKYGSELELGLQVFGTGVRGLTGPLDRLSLFLYLPFLLEPLGGSHNH